MHSWQCKQPEPENSNEPVSKAEGQEKLYQQGSSGSGKSIDYTGFRIAVTVTDNGTPDTFEIGGKNDIYWINTGDSTVFVKAKDKKNYLYYSPYALGLELSGTTIKNYIFSMAEGLLYVADSLTSQMVNGADDTVSGRSCATYTMTIPYEPTPGTAGNLKLKIWTDKEFGFTMKITYQDAVNNNTVESFSYEITTLQLKDATTPDGYAAVVAL